MTSAARSSSSTDRRSPELVVVTNVAMIKEEPIEEGIDEEEEVPAYSIDVSPEAAADAKVKLEVFNWSSKTDADECDNADGNRYTKAAK